MKRFCKVDVCGTVLVLVVGTGAFSAFPGASCFSILLLAVAFIVAMCVYRIAGRVSPVGKSVLFAAMALLTLGFALNIWYFTTYSGGAVSMPVLHNNDARVAWGWIMEINSGITFDGVEFDTAVSRQGFGVMMGHVSLVLGQDIGCLLVVNVLAVLLTIIFSGMIVCELFKDSVPHDALCRISGIAMLMTAAVAYFLASGVILIKDAVVCLVMAVFVYSLLRTHRKSSGAYTVLYIAVSLLLTLALAFFVRPNLLPLMALGCVLLANYRSRKALAICGVATVASVALYLYSIELGKAPGLEPIATHSYDFIGENDSRMAAYTAVAGSYIDKPFYVKLLYLPVSLAVQYLTPLPWGFMKHVQFGPSQLWAHMAYPWYAVGGLAIYYIVFCMSRSPRILMRTTVYAASLTVITAYLTGGTIARYCLPWLVLVVPSAVWAWQMCRRCKSFKIYAVMYTVCIMAVLGIVWYLQASADKLGGGGARLA